MRYVKLQFGCLLVILYIVITYMRAIKRGKIKTNRQYNLLMLVAPIAVIFDGITAWTVNHMDIVPSVVNRLAHLLFFLFMDFTIIITSRYMYDLLIGYDKTAKKKVLLDLPGMISVLLTTVGIGELHYIKMAGLTEVRTVLNSGNIIFSSEADMNEEIIENIISEHFKMKIPVYLMKIKELEDILAHSPKWWNTGEKDRYDNLIFILSDDSAKQIREAIGQPSENLEQIEIYKNVIFWTFDINKYQKCNWWKRTAENGIAPKLTIRTANTVNKLI